MDIMDINGSGWMNSVNCEQELEPQLRAFVQTMDNGWKMIRHPLVYAVPFHDTPFDIARLNAMFKHKEQALREATAAGKFSTIVALYERPYRIEVLKQFRHDMDMDQYLDLVRDIWIDSENIWQNKRAWRSILKPLVGKDAFCTMLGLEDMLTVYRGGKYKDGFSWTLCLNTAEWFAKRFADKDKPAPVWTATIPKSRAVAHFTDRGENEIVWLPTKHDIINRV